MAIIKSIIKEDSSVDIKASENHDFQINQILSSINDLVFVLDKESRFVEYYGPSDQLYLNREKFLGKKHSEVMPSAINNLFSKTFRKNKRGKIGTYEYPLKINGREKWFQVKQSPIFKDGHFIGSVAVIRDITTQKQLEHKLKESEQKFRCLSDHAPVAIWESNCSAVKKYIRDLQSKGIKNIGLHFKNNRKDLIKCISLFRITNYNKAVLTLFEVNSKREYIEFRKRVTKHEELIKNYIDFFHALASGKTYFVKEEIKITAKNNLKHVLLQYSIPPGYEMSWEKVIATIFDITDRKEAERKLKAYQDQLEKLIKDRTSKLIKEIEQRKKTENKIQRLYETEGLLRQKLEKQIKERNEFTRALVHELKTPLTPLVGASDLLVEKLMDSQYSDLAKQIFKGAMELNVRIDELFSLIKADIGSLKLDYETINPKVIIDEIIEYMNTYSIETNHPLGIDISQYLPNIYCDKNRIKQIFLNLINNAIKFTPTGTPITISACKKNSSILFRVKDSGPGIPKEIRKKMFIPYNRIDSDRENFSGLGLGIALCKKFVELHGGHIWVKTFLGKGTIISFTIPINKQVVTLNKDEDSDN